MLYRIADIPATRYDREVTYAGSSAADTRDLSEIILWVGVDAHAVNALVNGGDCIETTVRRRLQAMIDSGDISITQEYTVSASVTVTCNVQETIEAQSESAAADLMHELISDGNVYDLLNDHTIDDIDVTGVEKY
tara:strand:- start:703 stop:1107 length:405 start_codon:yes stop_codon:yes gene_type:complete